MVKCSIKVTHNAHYEAGNRTTGIAMKPAVGKQIFSDNLIHAAAGSFKGTFDTERFVFGKIRDFTNRIASHGDHAQTIVAAKALGHQHAASTDDIHDAQPFLMVANSYFYSMSDVCAPLASNSYDSLDLTRTTLTVKFDVLNNKTASGPWLGLKRASGFATAPIWYQQSMATGPPQ